MNFISYLNMHRSRLGYVNCVLLVADIQLDSLASLRNRLDQFLFTQVYPDDPRFDEFKNRIDEKSWQELSEMKIRRGKRIAKRTRKGVIQNEKFESYSVSELWLYQNSMRSHIGHVLPEDSNEPIELAKSLGFLSPGYALTEFGNIIKLFLLENIPESTNPLPYPNPLVVYDYLPVRILYLYSLLKLDMVFLAMLDSLSSGSCADDALKNGLNSLIKRLDTGIRLDEVNQAKGLFELSKRINKIRISKKGATERPVDKAQKTPRLEFCVDLGLLERLPIDRNEEAIYQPTAHLEKVPIALGGLMSQPTASSQWLDREFFKGVGLLYNRTLQQIEDSNLRLLYFVRGCSFVGRRLGFIPGRTAGMVGALMAWREGFRLEIAEIYDEVYRVPRGKWANYIKFSGGSRLDSEFLVSIDSTLEEELAGVIRTQ